MTYQYAKVLHRRKMIPILPDTWKRDEMATYEWWYGFKGRFPQLSIRVTENISTSRAEAFNKQRISSFFVEAASVLASAGVTYSPHLIYNCDETGITSVPNTSQRVVALKGQRNVEQVQVGEFM
jgi:hypothetical protein